LRRDIRKRIILEVGDITEKEVDAIVNAANNDLILGGGLAGAIRKKGGPEIQEECTRIGPIDLGGAAITGAGRLKARFVIHAASMRLGGKTTAASLRSSVKATLKIAQERSLRSIAIPAIGTGIAGFPKEEAAEIMLEEVARHLEEHPELEKVYFVLFDEATYNVFKRKMEEMFGAGGKEER